MANGGTSGTPPRPPAPRYTTAVVPNGYESAHSRPRRELGGPDHFNDEATPGTIENICELQLWLTARDDGRVPGGRSRICPVLLAVLPEHSRLRPRAGILPLL